MQQYDPLIEVIEKINETFNVHLPIEEKSQHQDVKIGFEIEVSASCYCPEAFTNGQPNSQVDRVFTSTEHKLMPLLKALHNCGVERTGSVSVVNRFEKLGRYYEFMLPASQSAQNVKTLISFLTKNDFIPETAMPSVHFTAGNIQLDKDAYIALTFLEILFCTPERLQSTAWKRSYQAGIKKRSAHELKNGDTIASEFRSLLLPKNDQPRHLFVDYIFTVMRNLHVKSDLFHSLKSEVIKNLTQHNLPDYRWQNSDQQLWDQLAYSLPNMRKNILPIAQHVL